MLNTKTQGQWPPVPKKNSFNINGGVFVFNVPPTAKVIHRWGHGLKSYPTDW